MNLLLILLVAIPLIFIAYLAISEPKEFLNLVLHIFACLLLVIAVPFHLLFNKDVKEHKRKMMEMKKDYENQQAK